MIAVCYVICFTAVALLGMHRALHILPENISTGHRSVLAHTHFNSGDIILSHRYASTSILVGSPWSHCMIVLVSNAGLEYACDISPFRTPELQIRPLRPYLARMWESPNARFATRHLTPAADAMRLLRFLQAIRPKYRHTYLSHFLNSNWWLLGMEARPTLFCSTLVTMTLEAIGVLQPTRRCVLPHQLADDREILMRPPYNYTPLTLLTP